MNGSNRDGVGEGGGAPYREQETCEVSQQLLGVGYVSSSETHVRRIDGEARARREEFVNIQLVSEGEERSGRSGEVGGGGLSSGVELVESRPRH